MSRTWSIRTKHTSNKHVRHPIHNPSSLPTRTLPYSDITHSTIPDHAMPDYTRRDYTMLACDAPLRVWRRPTRLRWRRRAMLCWTGPLYATIPHHAMSHSTMIYSTIPYHAMPCYDAILYLTILRYININSHAITPTILETPFDSS